jgi:hypothetical protein
VASEGVSIWHVGSKRGIVVKLRSKGCQQQGCLITYVRKSLRHWLCFQRLDLTEYRRRASLCFLRLWRSGRRLRGGPKGGWRRFRGQMLQALLSYYIFASQKICSSLSQLSRLKWAWMASTQTWLSTGYDRANVPQFTLLSRMDSGRTRAFLWALRKRYLKSKADWVGMDEMGGEDGNG